jgi:hypothetical protein
MTDLPFDPAIYLLLNIHCLIGGIGAVVAQRKGYNLFLWLFLGLLGGTITFFVALMLADKSKQN